MRRKLGLLHGRLVLVAAVMLVSGCINQTINVQMERPENDRLNSSRMLSSAEPMAEAAVATSVRPEASVPHQQVAPVRQTPEAVASGPSGGKGTEAAVMTPSVAPAITASHPIADEPPTVAVRKSLPPVPASPACKPPVPVAEPLARAVDPPAGAVPQAVDSESPTPHEALTRHPAAPTAPAAAPDSTATGTQAVSPLLLFLAGLALLVLVTMVIFRCPRLSRMQKLAVRTVLALAAASMAASIPGFLKIEAPGINSGMLQGGGAICVLLLVYCIDPGKLGRRSGSKPAAGRSLAGGAG